MRYIISFLFFLLSLGTFGQTRAIKEAKSLLKSNKLSDAEKAIDKILQNEETKNNPNAWDIAGQIQLRKHEVENQKAYLRKPYDTLLLNSSVLKMTKYFIQCDSLSQIPDAKGKIKNKFRKDNAQSISNEINHLINGGYHFMSSEKTDEKRIALDYFDTYIKAVYHPMLEKIHDTEKDTMIPHVAYFACVTALKINDYKLVSKFGKYALNSPTYAQSAKQLLTMSYLEQGDSINYLSSLEEGVQKYPNDRFFFANLLDYYIRRDRIEDAMNAIDDIIAKNPNNSYCFYIKGFLYQNQQDYENAIEMFHKAIALDPQNAEAYSGLGLVYCILAQDYSIKASTNVNSPEYERDQQILRDYYQHAKDPYEKARELRPEQKELWLNGLYRVYYNLHLGDQFSEIESLLKQ
jgi:tetratricopeptide (TPR) repeat protein